MDKLGFEKVKTELTSNLMEINRKSPEVRSKVCALVYISAQYHIFWKPFKQAQDILHKFQGNYKCYYSL